MKEKFTPGEWEIEEKEMSCGSMFRYGFQVVCWGKHRRIAYMETGSLGDKEEMQANAYLIAAAPEMYECICDALTDLEMPEGMRRHFEAVLKKARGEE